MLSDAWNVITAANLTWASEMDPIEKFSAFPDAFWKRLQYSAALNFYTPCTSQFDWHHQQIQCIAHAVFLGDYGRI
jgi:hypothetical protein